MMKNLALGFTACTIFLISNEGYAQPTSSGVIHFEGSIVESTYEFSMASAASVGKSIKLIEVEPGVVIAVNMAARSADGTEPLFTTAFEALKNVSPARDNVSASKRGVLTISYR